MKRFSLTASIAASLLCLSASYAMPAQGIATLDIPKAEASAKAQINKILWTHAGDLEAQAGQVQNIGTAGMLNGVSNGYIIVGGGANFPDGGPEKGGAKKYYSDVYVLEPSQGTLKQINHTNLSHEIGYGASITAKDGIYYIGGSPINEEANKIIRITADKHGKISEEEIASLPFTFSDGTAVMKDRTIYIAAGKQNGKPSNKFYAFNLDNKELIELPAVPGEATRTQCVAQILGNDMCLFSGGDAVAYTDGWKYDITNSTWSRISDVLANGQKISLLGAGSVKINDEEMLVVGGFNKEVYDDAVSKLTTLKGDELASFKNAYFGANPAMLKWNKKILLYNASNNAWHSIGEVPFDAPCGEALINYNGYIYSINGEIKPGTRSNRMYAGLIE